MTGFLRDLTWVSIMVRVVMAVVIGGIIGMEREIKNHPAGFRTYMLVCLGACLVMMTNQYICEEFQTGDPSRLGAQVISGIGFLGAGTILVTRNNKVKGLTTAAGLWSAACIGLAIGIGFYEGALAVGIILLLILTVVSRMDHFLQSKSKYLQLYLGFASSEAVTEFMMYCNENDLKVKDIQLIKGKTNGKGEVAATLSLRERNKTNHPALVAKIAALDGVKYIEEV